MSDENANIYRRTSGYFDIPLIYVHYLDVSLMGGKRHKDGV